MAKKLTKEQCLEWFKEPGINPITKSKIKINSKTGLYPKYEKQCAEYKNQPVKKEKSISKSSSSSSTKQVTIKSNVNEDDINLASVENNKFLLNISRINKIDILFKKISYGR